MNKGRKTTKRRCIVWYSSATEEERVIIFNDVAFRICVYLKQGYSINLAKAMVRNELHLGFKLVDHIGRTSEQVEQMKQLNKRG